MYTFTICHSLTSHWPLSLYTALSQRTEWLTASKVADIWSSSNAVHLFILFLFILII